MAKKMSMAAWEKSGADKKADAKGAKKAGVSAAKFEGSKADKAADKKGFAAFTKGKK
jgi:hypothetical protein